ncbi:AAEL017307-PA, partial [Aedes aegypti]
MIDHKVLNLFNSLFATSVRIEFGEGWCRLYFSNTIRNHICPLIVDACASFVGLLITIQNWSVFVKHVSHLSSILRYSSLTLAGIFSDVWFLMQRKKYYILLEKLLHFDQCYNAMINSWSNETEASFTRHQILFLVASHVTIMSTYVAAFMWFQVYGPNTKILIICCVFIGFHFMLQQLYAVFFAEHLSMRYNLLSKVVEQRNSRKILLITLKLYDQLDSMQKIVSEVFGMSCLVSTLIVFLNTAIVFYTEMIYIVQGGPVVMILSEVITMIPIIIMFYAMMKSFDRLIVEERKFKTAFMSLQYQGVESQLGEYSNFLDVINLKLMTDSPRITACGLFTLNLQAFNNILAAIVTYIMILFQFKDFEKT